jgi:hypothetical protein
MGSHMSRCFKWSVKRRNLSSRGSQRRKPVNSSLPTPGKTCRIKSSKFVSSEKKCKNK